VAEVDLDGFGVGVEVSLAVDDLVADAQERLTRSFTVGECATYQIDPCPTLDDIRSR
jgi:hypothetical protein